MSNTSSSLLQEEKEKKVTGIMGAMDDEIEALLECIQIEEEQKIANNIFYKGSINNQNVVLVKSGIGKVQAGLTATILAQKYGVNEIIFTGIAGSISPDVRISDIVVSNALVHHDFDLTVFGLSKGHVDGFEKAEFQASPDLINRLKTAAQSISNKEGKLHVGKILTGDQFISSADKALELRNQFNALATDMESAAVAQVATVFDIPFVALRTISDDSNSKSYEEMKQMTASNSAKIVSKVFGV